MSEPRLTHTERWQIAYDGLCEHMSTQRLYLKRTTTDEELEAQMLSLEGWLEDLKEGRFGRQRQRLWSRDDYGSLDAAGNAGADSGLA